MSSSDTCNSLQISIPDSLIQGCCHGLQLIWKVTNRTDRNPPSLNQPYDAAFVGENIVVAEGLWPFSRLQIFSGKGRSVQAIGQGLLLPFGVTVDVHGSIVMTDHHERTVKVVVADTEEIVSWTPALFEWPTGISVDRCSGRYYVCDWLLGTINIYEDNGQKVREFKTNLSSESTFSCPAYVAFDPWHRIVVSDAFDCSVKVYEESGRLLFKIEKGAGKENVVDPRGVCVDSHSNIVVADWGDNRVKLYSADGRWIQDLLTTDDGIQYPRSVAVSESNLLVVTEQKLNAVPALKLFG